MLPACADSHRYRAQEFSGVQKDRREARTHHPRPLQLNVRMARALADAVKVGLNEGRSPNEISKRETGKHTLEALFDEFLQHRRSRRGAYLSDATKEHYRAAFSLYLTPWARRKLNEVQDAEVAELHARVGRDTPVMANHVVALVSALFSYAKERKLFKGANPAQGIKRFPEVSRERFLHPNELPKFFSALLDEPNDTIRDFILVSLLTGVRRAAVQAMRKLIRIADLTPYLKELGVELPQAWWLARQAEDRAMREAAEGIEADAHEKRQAELRTQETIRALKQTIKQQAHEKEQARARERTQEERITALDLQLAQAKASVVRTYSTPWLEIVHAVISEFYEPRRQIDPERDEVILFIENVREKHQLEPSKQLAGAIFTITKPTDRSPKKRRGWTL